MIKVFRLKDLIKIAFVVIAIIFSLIILRNITFKKNKVEEENKPIETKPTMSEDILVYCLGDLVYEEDSNKKLDLFDSLNRFAFNTEFSIEDKNETNKTNVTKLENENIVAESNKIENNNVQKAPTNVKVEVVENSVNPRSTEEIEGIKVNNTSGKDLSQEDLNFDNATYSKKKVLIYHTHTCESYTPTEQNNYEQTGNYRTTDLKYSVAGVGDELENQLKLYNIEVIHDKTYHDYPAYNGSYGRSMDTIKSILEKNNDIDIAIDLHRDAIGDSSYAPKVKIGDEYASQLMFVMGTDLGNEKHVNWLLNFKFALKVQKKANELYPGLFKPIILRKSEYNQSASKACCIIEVGATGNTLEESKNSMKYLARVISEI